MKKVFYLSLLLLLAGCASTPEQRAANEAHRELVYQQSLEALRNQRFVVEADRVMFRRGRTAFVSSITNFVMVNGDMATVQLAFNNSRFAGPNGLGGITLDGRINNVNMRENRGNVTYEFSVQGVGISARVFLTMGSGRNHARVTVSHNFSSQRITFSGYLVPLEEARIFKGRSI